MALFRRQQDSGDQNDSRSKRGGVRRETRIDIDLSDLERRAVPEQVAASSSSGRQSAIAAGGRSTRITTRSMPIGQLLIQAGAVNAKQVEAALEKQKAAGGLIGQILVSMNACRPDDIAAALGKQFRFTQVDLAAFAARTDALLFLTPEKCADLKAIPFERIGKLLCVAVANVLNRKAIKEVEEISGLKVKAFTANWPEIQAAIATAYTPGIAQAAATLEAERAGGRIPLAMAEDMARQLSADGSDDDDLAPIDAEEEEDEELEEIDPAEFARQFGFGSSPASTDPSEPAEIPVPFPVTPQDAVEELEDVPILMDDDSDSLDEMTEPDELPEPESEPEAMDAVDSELEVLEAPEMPVPEMAAPQGPSPEEEASVYIDDAKELRSQGRLDEAVKRLEAGAASVGGVAGLDGLLAEIRKEAQEKARIEHDRLQKVAELLHAGRADRANGDLESAVAKFREASELDPKNNVLSRELVAAENELLNVKAEAVAKQKAEEEARRLEAERKAEEEARKQKHIEELFDLVQKARDAGKFEVAQSRLQDILDLEKSNARAGGQLLEVKALIAARDKQRESSMETIVAAAEKAREDGGFEAVLAQIEALDPAVQREPRMADVRHDMESRLSQKQKAEAAAAEREAAEAADYAARIKDLLAKAEQARQAGKLEEAEGHLVDAAVLEPENADTARKLEAVRQDIHRRHEEEEERRKADEDRRAREARVREVLRESAQDREAGRLELALRKTEDLQREHPDREDVKKAAELLALDIRLRDEKAEQQRLADEAHNRKAEEDLKLKARKAAEAEAESRRMSVAMGGEKRISSATIDEESLVELRLTPEALHAGLARKLSPDSPDAGSLEKLPVAQRFARNRQELRSMAEAARAAEAALEDALDFDDEPEAILEALPEDAFEDEEIVEIAEVVAIPETRMSAEAIAEDEFVHLRANSAADPAFLWALAVGGAGKARALPVDF